MTVPASWPAMNTGDSVFSAENWGSAWRSASAPKSDRGGVQIRSNSDLPYAVRRSVRQNRVTQSASREIEYENFSGFFTNDFERRLARHRHAVSLGEIHAVYCRSSSGEMRPGLSSLLQWERPALIGFDDTEPQIHILMDLDAVVTTILRGKQRKRNFARLSCRRCAGRMRA